MFAAHKLRAAAAGGGGVELVFSAFAGAADDPRVSYPTVNVGDLIVLCEFENAATPVSTPSGYTLVAAGYMAVKISDGTETGQVPALTDGTGSIDNSMVIVFTANATSVTPVDIDSEETTTLPSDQVKNAASLGANPKVVIAYYAADRRIDDDTENTFTGDTPDGSLLAADGGNVQYKIYNTGGNDITVGITEDYGVQLLASVILEVA